MGHSWLSGEETKGGREGENDSDIEIHKISIGTRHKEMH
jgi:hypothetical protein